jgi:hypothetical protein
MKIVPKIKYTKLVKTPTPKLGGNICTIWSNDLKLIYGCFLKIGMKAESINLGEVEGTRPQNRLLAHMDEILSTILYLN